MIKNKFFYLITFIYAISLWSCSSEQMDEIETLVTFKICLDEHKTQHARAISDGTSVDQLMYAVYTTDGTPVILKNIKNNAGAIRTEDGLSLTINLRNGGEYKLVCWAQNSERAEYYNVSDDMKEVTINYELAKNNDELQDAFFGISEAFSLEDATIQVKLKRPFAQLNAGTHPFEWQYVSTYHKFVIKQSSAIIKNVPNKLNLLDGTVSGNEDVYFKPAIIPTEEMLMDVDGNNDLESYIYLSMSYILASVEETEHVIDFYFYNENGDAVKFSRFYEEQFEEGFLDKIKIQRNLKTHIVGQVLTVKGALDFVTPPEGSN